MAVVGLWHPGWPRRPRVVVVTRTTSEGEPVAVVEATLFSPLTRVGVAAAVVGAAFHRTEVALVELVEGRVYHTSAYLAFCERKVE